MEVHPPHHPLNTWRDFFIHIATITIGLLIAIGLEQTVEYFHHRHIVHVARENIRRELEQNEAEARTNTLAVQANADNMKGNIARARTIRDQPETRNIHFRFNFSWDSFSESAWLSARDSGALTYMPVEEVQQYDETYGEQQIVNREAVDIFTHQAELGAPLFMEKDDAPKLTSEESQSLLQGCAITYMRLLSLNQLIQELDKLYTRTLKQP